MKKALTTFLSMILALGTFALAQQEPSDQGVKQDMKDAGHSTARATKKSARKVKRGTKRVAHKTARATRRAADKVEDKTTDNPK